MTRRQGEGQLSDAIREALNLEPGLVIYRNSQAAMRKGSRIYKGGLGNGSADLIGVLSIHVVLVNRRQTDGGTISEPRRADIGRMVALEVKRPGEAPTPAELIAYRSRPWKSIDADRKRLLDQEAWLEDVRKHGGFACFVDSVESARAAIARARTGATS